MKKNASVWRVVTSSIGASWCHEKAVTPVDFSELEQRERFVARESKEQMVTTV